MPALFRQISLAIAAAIVLVISTGPAAALSDFCLEGGSYCDIQHPVYVNVYWDTSEAQWNADVGLGDPNLQIPGITVARVDLITVAMCRSNYFGGLNQYGVIGCDVHPSFFVTGEGCGAPPPDLDTARSMIAAGIQNPIGCLVAKHPELAAGNVILNVLLPPQVAKSGDFCSPFGFHDVTSPPFGGLTSGLTGNPTPTFYYTFVPTVAGCNDNVAKVAAVLSHEMVEAATDPDPGGLSGWKTIGENGEIADSCGGAATNFLYVRLSDYFSRDNGGCMTFLTGAPVSNFAPQFDSVIPCGSGMNSKITIKGHFDPRPWDLAPGGKQTLFLQGVVTDATGANKFKVGGFAQNFPPDSVSFSSIQWTTSAIGNENTIVANGFVGDANTKVAAGDHINITVSSPMTGQPVSLTGDVPSAHGVQDFNVGLWPDPPPPYFVGRKITVFGKLMDTAGCPMGDASFTLSSTSDPASALSPWYPTTYEDGRFIADYTPTGPAGTHHVAITSPVSEVRAVAVHPIAEDLSASLGPVAGGQNVKLSGVGFDPAVANNLIRFRYQGSVAQATNLAVSGDGKSATFTTPHSPLGGDGTGMATVVIVVNGQDSLALPYQYFIPNKPILSFSVDCIAKSLSKRNMKVDAYAADGSTAAETINLSASYPAFANNNGANVSSLTVSPGDVVTVNGDGPFKAAASVNANLSVSEGFPVDAPVFGCVDPAAKYVIKVIDYIPSGDPVETVTLPSVVDKGAQNVAVTTANAAWTTGPTAVRATGVLVLQNPGQAAAAAPKVDVRSLGSRDLSSLNEKNMTGFVRAGSSSTRLQILGPNLSIASPGNAGTLSGTVSFALPPSVRASDYAIVYSGQDGKAWLETASSSSNIQQRASLSVPFAGAGTYALAQRVRR